jgi:hypothetical protein
VRPAGQTATGRNFLCWDSPALGFFIGSIYLSRRKMEAAGLSLRYQSSCICEFFKNKVTPQTAKTSIIGCKKALVFAVKGIQVDGGSEFMAEFEQACKDKGLTLFVLPPKRPQLNGAVERECPPRKFPRSKRDADITRRVLSRLISLGSGTL